MKNVATAFLFFAFCGVARAQTIDDGIMMPAKTLCTGFMFGRDSWDRYWEGELKRSNANVGQVTTQSVAWFGNYGITDRLNVIAMVPYVWTRASSGTLQGMSGIQDATFAVKYNALRTDLTSRGTLKAFVVGSAALPLTDYTPDFYPLSIGSASKRLSTRLTLAFDAHAGWFVEGSGGYTWRDTVSLDRVSYFTNGRLFLTNQVAMPNVFDYTVSAGWRHGLFRVPISFTQQRTQGGGDIRRQDMPFVSNRMNYSRVDIDVLYPLPVAPKLSVNLGASRTLSGRNVGESMTYVAGLLYTFRF